MTDQWIEVDPLPWNLDITRLYVTKSSVQQTIFFTTVIVILNI